LEFLQGKGKRNNTSKWLDGAVLCYHLLTKITLNNILYPNVVVCCGNLWLYCSWYFIVPPH